MKLALIWAMSENRVIGKDGDLPWHLPVDLRHFQTATRGCPVIMGRKTWESLDVALPGRRNLIITRQADYVAAGAEVLATLDDAIETAREADRVFVVGGSEIYRMAIPIADELWVTFVHGEVDGDTFFPDFDLAQWRLVDQTSHAADGDNQFACTIARMEPRKKSAATQRQGASHRR